MMPGNSGNGPCSLKEIKNMRPKIKIIMHFIKSLKDI